MDAPFETSAAAWAGAARAATSVPGEGEAEGPTSLTAVASVDAPFETRSGLGGSRKRPSDLRPRGEARTEGHDLAHSFRVCRRAIRDLRSDLGGSLPGENLGLRPGGLGMGTASMGGEERTPSLERPDPLGNPIVKLLVDKRCSRRVDGDNVRCRLCGYQGLC